MSEEEVGYIYLLEDPRTGDPVYVGSTTAPKRRYHAHRSRPHSEPLAAWKSELNEEGEELDMNVIEKTGIDELAERETEVMEELAEDHDLLNIKKNPGYESQSSLPYGPDEDTDPQETPAISFGETKNNALYAPPSVADAFNEAWELDAKPMLYHKWGIRGTEKREWHTAALRFVTEHPEEVAELVIKAREEKYGPIEDSDDA